MAMNIKDEVASLFKLDTNKNIQGLRDLTDKVTDIMFPASLTNPLVDYMLERSYLEDITKNANFGMNPTRRRIAWLKIKRLPVHPGDSTEYDLLSRWQSTLASLNTWNNTVVFLLHRRGGVTNIYIGTELTSGRGVNSLKEKKEKEYARTESALMNCLPGIMLERVTDDEETDIEEALERQESSGAITGIPSFRKDVKYSELQTLDALAFGIRDSEGRDTDYSVIVIAEPIPDAEISEMIATYQKIGSDIHEEVRRTHSKSGSASESRSGMVGLADFLKTLSFIDPTGLSFVESFFITGQKQKSISFSSSESVETLNKAAEYAEKITDKHASRLRNGRNMGFWNVGVYVTSDWAPNVGTVLGMLRSIYSGDESYIEPIRTHQFNRGSGAHKTITSFRLLPIRQNDSGTKEDTWHVLGKRYQYFSTPINTHELSLVTSLPRKDVPGLRFVKTAVRFANNSNHSENATDIVIGSIKDYGIKQKSTYALNMNAMVRHSLIVGSTGSGKSTTCRRLIQSVESAGKPLLIIEPAKEEYVKWAVEQRKKGKKVNIFMPGSKNFMGESVEQLRLNPFQPAAVEGADIDMLTRCEQFTTLVNASLPSSDVLPIIFDETFYTFLLDKVGASFMRGETEQLQNYPLIEETIKTARKVLAARGYTDEVQQGIGAAVETRLTYLSRGKRGDILNANKSTDWDKLFNQTTVVNLSHIANPKDRALIMSLLLLSLYEYRQSQFNNQSGYREKANRNELMHLTVVEEAHNVLSAPRADYQGTGNPQQVAIDLFCNMLAEIRAYGEGLMIVEQSPTKLTSDAVKNTNYKIVHRLAYKDDCDMMASALALRPEQAGILPMLEVGDAIIFGDQDDAASWVNVNRL